MTTTHLIYDKNIFLSEMEQEAITRITKFAKLAKSMNMEIAVGFSGGKDSLVVYDLCKRAGIDCKFYFNHSLEAPETLAYIRTFTDVIRRRNEVGFFEYLQKVKKGLLPTPQIAWCCEVYKHNAKYIDDCSITGIRRAESNTRKNRQIFESKNKTFEKKNKDIFNEYFKEECRGIGSHNKISLRPIVDWSDSDIWQYIYKYKLKINPLYNDGERRIGCMICPKSDFTRNVKMLIKYPKLIDCAIGARERSGNINNDYFIKSDNKDYTHDKVYYMCRWLNRGFLPFTKKQEKLYQQFRKIYNEL